MRDFQIPDPTVNAYVLLLNTSDIVSRYSGLELSKVGITSTQYAVLVTLQSCEQAPTLTELAERLFRTKNSLTTVIGKMERDDLVKRVRDDTDRRAIRVMVSEKGKKLFETALAPSRELVYQVMSCYNEDDVSRLSELLQKIRSHTLQMLARGNDDNMAAVPSAVRTDSRQIESK